MIGVSTLGGPQLLADFGAAHAGQAQVDQHEVRLEGDGLFEARPAIAGQHRAEASCSSITPMVSRRLSSSSITRIVCIGFPRL